MFLSGLMTSYCRAESEYPPVQSYFSMVRPPIKAPDKKYYESWHHFVLRQVSLAKTKLEPYLGNLLTSEEIDLISRVRHYRSPSIRTELLAQKLRENHTLFPGQIEKILLKVIRALSTRCKLELEFELRHVREMVSQSPRPNPENKLSPAANSDEGNDHVLPIVNLKENTFEYGGVVRSDLSFDALRLFKALAEVHPAAVFCNQLDPPIEKPHRVIQSLPKALKPLIKTAKGKGTSLDI